MEKIREWRASKSLSLEEAGALVGVSGVQWHRYETGTRRVSSEKVPSLSRVTGIPPEELRPDLADIFAPTRQNTAA